MKQRPHPEYLVSALNPLQQVYDSGETKVLFQLFAVPLDTVP